VANSQKQKFGTEVISQKKKICFLAPRFFGAKQKLQ
jgi:hypothetical protein